MANQKTGFIQDAFTATSANAQWTVTQLGSATFSFTNQGASVVFPATTSASTDGDLAFASGQVLDLTGSFVRFNVTSVSGAGATHTDNVLRIRQNSSNYVTIFYEAGTLFFSQVVAGSQTNNASVAYNATTHAWWQIREKGGTTYWETSSDGITFTQRFARANPVTLTSVDILIGGLCFGADTSPTNFTFRSLNYPQPGTTTSTSSTSISSTSTSISSTSTSISSTSSSISSTSTSVSTSSTSTSISSTSSSISSTSSSVSSTSISSTSSSTSISSTSTSISSTSFSSTSLSSTSSSTSISSTSTSFSSTSSSISSTSSSVSSTSFSSTSSSSSTSTTTLPPPYYDFSYQDVISNSAGLAQSKSGNGTAPTVTVTWGSNTTSGNTVFVVVGGNAASPVISITDSQGNLYSKVLGQIVASSTDVELWMASNIKGGTTPTVTITLVSIFTVDVEMQEWSGVGSLDQSTISNNGLSSSTALSSDPSGIAEEDELVLGFGVIGNTGGLVAGAGYSNLTTSATNFSVGLESKIISTDGPQTATFTANTTGSWICGVATFFLTVTPPTSRADLNPFNAVQYGNVTVDDGDYFIEKGARELVEMFKNTHQNNTDAIAFTWKGRSTLSTLISPLLIQIFNVSTPGWETLAVINLVPADTDTTITVTKNTNLSNYYDTTNTVTFRTYQKVN